MKRSTLKKINKFVSGLTLAVLMLALFSIMIPTRGNPSSFAITASDAAQTVAASANPEQHYTPQQRTRAPEPSTLFLMLSGILGMLARFAKSSFQRFKRLLDVFLATVGIFITSPILLVSALFIKLTSKGPVIYKQTRVGMKGEIFEIYKLRTMVRDAEKETGAVWAKADDPRITPLGKLLRKTRIDEIPQFINVLKGEMSIVGPRPERPEMVRDLKALIKNYEKRLTVKPGITGFAQIYHKYDESLNDVKKKLRYDLLYSRKMSAATDLDILAQTFMVVLTGKGAR